MIKVLKTDLFRLFKSKAFYVFPFFVAIIMIIGSLLSAYVIEPETDDQEQSGIVAKEYKEEENDQSLQLNLEVKSENGQKSSQSEKITVKIGTAGFFEFLYNGEILLFLGIVLVIFCTCETRMGFVKNAAGSVKDRGYMPLSKIIIGIVITIIYIIEYAIIYTVVSVVVSVIGGNPLEYQSLPSGDAPKFIGFILLVLLIHIVFIAMIVLFHELTYSRSLGIVLSVAFAAGLLEKLATGFVFLMRHFFGILNNFNMEKYLLMFNITEGYTSEKYHPEIVLIMSIIYIGVFILLSMFISRRKEIK